MMLGKPHRFLPRCDEAWQQLGSRPLADLTLAEIAAHADVDAALAVRLQVTRNSLFWAKWRA